MDDSRFRILFENIKFTSRLFNITFDEGHCISQWGGDDFRPEYKKTQMLRWLLPDHVRFHIASATMPPLILDDVRTILGICEDTIEYVRLSNDRPNIHFMVAEMQYSVKSMHDLDRILKLDPEHPPPKFMVFSNKRKEAERLAKKYRAELPPELRHKIVWFHSGMSREFKEDMMEKLRRGEIWGIVCTDAAGMVCGNTRITCNLKNRPLCQGLDIPDIELVIQWGYTASLCTLFQRLGRAARNAGIEATGVYLVEQEHFDLCKVQRAARKKKTDMRKRQKKTRGFESEKEKNWGN